MDDAVISLGATIAGAARAGARVLVLTVFAGDPVSRAPAGGWDRRAGFETQGEAASARREEDRRACRLLHATPVWLPYGDEQYERGGGEREIIESVHDVVRGADVALLPGYPLSHRDHAWLTRALLTSRLPVRDVALYAEQPYAFRVAAGLDSQPEPVPWLADAVGGQPRWIRVASSPRDWVAKWRAVRQYASQLPLLGMTSRAQQRLRSLLWQEVRAGGEEIAWLA
jgi:LmbE family N-acetylglucosaminyl deacetylase